MTDLPSDRVDASTEAWASTLPVVEVRELLVTLGKALRAYQLYEENNPVYQRFVTSLREDLGELLGEMDRVRLGVEESRLTLDGAEVYASESRTESLAFLLFKDGIREVSLLPGLEGEELERFLGVLHRARHVGLEGDDLLTILWEEELEHFRYEYVDVLAEGVEIPEPGGGAEEADLRRVLEGELGEEEEEEEEEGEEAEGEEAAEGGEARAGTVSREDFNPTLYSFDAREREVLDREVELEMKRDLRGDVLAALFDRLEEGSHAERQSEILEVLRGLLPNFLGRGALGAATQVLSELRELETRKGVFDEVRRGEAAAVVDEVSAPETMEELVRALEEGSVSPSPRELSEFLSHLRVGALGPLLKASETVDSRDLQPVLREAVKGIAGRNRESLVGLLGHEDGQVVAGAARLVGRLGIAEAGPALAELLGHASPAVRLSAVEAAVTLKASTVAGALERALEDEEREVRIAAARALGSLRYRPAAVRLRGLVTGRRVRAADLTEKIAVFEAYGEVGDPKAVAVLDKLLNGKSLLGRREPAEIRACAAVALGRVATPEAVASLREAAGEDDPVVRSAVGRALRAEGDRG